MFAKLQAPIVRENGLGRGLLERADALEPDVIDVLVELEREVNAHHAEEREKEMAVAKAQAAGRR